MGIVAHGVGVVWRCGVRSAKHFRRAEMISSGLGIGEDQERASKVKAEQGRAK